jgi:hypothetical protein
MVHPVRDTLIALVLTLAGLAGLAYGVPRLMVDENDVAGSIAAVVGGLTAFFSALMLLNFLWGLKVANRMKRGENVIARWSVPAEVVDAYLAAEKARPWAERSRWKPKPGQGAEVVFSANGVLAGGRYHGLSSTGLQHFHALAVLPGHPALLQFASREIASGPGGSLRFYASVLRLPLAHGAEDAAETVLTHFRQVLAGKDRANQTFWAWRIRIGVAATCVGLALGLSGWLLAEFKDWRADDAAGLAAMVMMIAGVMITLVGGLLALMATKFHRAANRRSG